MQRWNDPRLMKTIQEALSEHGYTVVSAMTRDDGSPVLHLILGVIETPDRAEVEQLIESTREWPKSKH